VKPIDAWGYSLQALGGFWLQVEARMGKLLEVIMIASSVVKEIERLLSSGGHSQRQIAQQLGVSRGTVNAIARGKRPTPRRHRHARSEEIEAPMGPLTRCPGCGGLVLMPCLLCRVRAIKDRQRWKKNRPRRAARVRPNCQSPNTSPIDRSPRKGPTPRVATSQLRETTI